MPPGAARRRGHRRGARAAAGDGAGARRRHGRRGDRPVRSGQAAGGGSPRAGRARARRGPASTCSATPPSGCCTSARRPTCARGCARTSPAGRCGAPVERAVEAAARVETRPLGSEFEAALLELELIERLRPPANTRGANPDRACYLVLTLDEPVPRLRVAARPGTAPAVTAGPLRVAHAGRGHGGGRARHVRAARVPAAAAGRRRLVPGRRDRHLLRALPRRRRGGSARGRRGRRPAPGSRAARRRTRPTSGCAAGWQRLSARAPLRGGGGRARPAGRPRSRPARARRGCAGRPRRSGVVLAPDIDERFVQAFACAGGRVVARRRLPRAGDGRLEADALVAALAHGLRRPARSRCRRPRPTRPGSSPAALARPSAALRAVAVDAGTLADATPRLVRLRRTVPLRG